MWLAKKRHDIGYLLQAESDSVSDPQLKDICEYRTLYKFKNPVTIKDLKAKEQEFLDWPAYSGNFQRSSAPIPKKHWYKLNQLAAEKNSEYQQYLEESGLHFVSNNDIQKNIKVLDYTLEDLIEDIGLNKTTLASWIRSLQHKRQAIIYGPPGTGKTFVAEHLAKHLISGGDGSST